LAGEVHDACGVFGVSGRPDASLITYWGIFSLQHRGQESAGVAAWDGRQLRVAKGMGLVTEVLSPEAAPDRQPLPPGAAAIGHVRYSTQGASELVNAQPLLMESRFGPLALAHNGNLVNARAWRRHLEAQGALFQGTSDTEVLAHLIAVSRQADWRSATAEALNRVAGGYAFVILSPEGILAARDPYGIRPLVLGRMPEGQAVVASETCALDAVGARFLREVDPGELLWINGAEIRAQRFAPAAARALCAFENVYFARADSRIGGVSAHSSRRRLGHRLAQEAPAAVDVVVGVPDSSLPQAVGYAEALGVPFDLGLVKNRYVARTFIAPSDRARKMAVELKLSAVPEVVAGKRVALVDDSLVRGTTARHIIQLLRRAGAQEVHMRIASPPYQNPCYYGIDTSRPDELIASLGSLEAIRDAIGADSLAYLSLAGLREALGEGGWCTACFGGPYPVPPGEAAGEAETGAAVPVAAPARGE
jgi:amidophosphoribosyltransferase